MFAQESRAFVHPRKNIQTLEHAFHASCLYVSLDINPSFLLDVLRLCLPLVLPAISPLIMFIHAVQVSIIVIIYWSPFPDANQRGSFSCGWITRAAAAAEFHTVH